MTDHDDGGPVVKPEHEYDYFMDAPAYPCKCEGVEYCGMSLRVCAAIRLGVPRSGNDKIDTMIVKSRRLDLAGHILTGLLVRERIEPRYHRRDIDEDTFGKVYARAALGYADNLLAKWRNQNADVQPRAKNPDDGGQPAPEAPA